jgi:hypothetical protein
VIVPLTSISNCPERVSPTENRLDKTQLSSILYLWYFWLYGSSISIILLGSVIVKHKLSSKRGKKMDKNKETFILNLS